MELLEVARTMIGFFRGKTVTEVRKSISGAGERGMSVARLVDAARAYIEAVKGERLARGEATDVERCVDEEERKAVQKIAAMPAELLEQYMRRELLEKGGSE